MISEVVGLLQRGAGEQLRRWFVPGDVASVVARLRPWRLSDDQLYRALRFNERLCMEEHPQAVMEWDQLPSGVLDNGRSLDPLTREAVEAWAINHTDVLRGRRTLSLKGRW